MNNLDFEIYEQIKPTKGLTEIYLGHIQFPWHYALADYSADRTEGIPFDVFDKVICRLLEMDGSLTMLELGSILGMNIEDDIQNGKYRDLAEYEILSEKVNQLIDFGIIENNDGFYTLTNKGKESVLVERKFRTLEDYNFSLYYDITGGQHHLAKSAFMDAARIESATTTSCDYEDEEQIKSFSNDQIVGIYSPEDGNSFSNLILNNVQEYINPVHFGVIYDFLKKEYRLECYNPMVKCALYTDAINKDVVLKDIILKEFLKKQTENHNKVSRLQSDFEDNAIEYQRHIEYKEFLEQDVSTDKIAYKEIEEILIPEEFWRDIESHALATKPNRVCLNVESLNVDVIKSIKRMASTNPSTKFFLSFCIKDDDVNITESHNLYICQASTVNNVLCTIDDVAIFKRDTYVYSYQENSYQREVVTRIDSEMDGKGIFDIFIRNWVPNYLQEFRDSISRDIVGEKGILLLASIDEKLNGFMPYIVDLKLKDVYNETISLRNEKMSELKSLHEESLKNELVKITGEAKLEEIKNLNEINSIEDKISSIEKHCFEEYTELIQMLSVFKTTLKERENYIRDMLLAKTYIIDTNVFINDPDILNKIKMPNKAVICAKVTDELDKFKIRTKQEDNIHEKASRALKNINTALKKDKGTVVKAIADIRLLPEDFTDRSADNRILCVALMYKDKNPCLLTSDNGLQVKAQICEIPTKDINEFYEMLKAKELEKAKGREIDNGDIVKTRKVNTKYSHNKYNNKKKR